MKTDKDLPNEAELISDPFEEYRRDGDPTKSEQLYAWQTAIGLQAVDGLETSDNLRRTAVKNIEGEITLDEAKALIDAYYKTDRKTKEPRVEEADKVSSRITGMIADKGFTFSAAQYLSIHRRLFEGIYKHAGKIRDYNISKQEWVLDGDTVIYGGAAELRATLEYDLSQERYFDYSGRTMDEIIRHLARFVSDLWQIHLFAVGNMRTTAVFFIKYLQSLGFDVTNDIFAKNAWYFRNAMVRANYNNLQKGVRETTEYLELFLRNLLLGENHPLQNRTMHISGALKQDAEPTKQDSAAVKQDFERLTSAGISVRTANNVCTLLKRFGFDRTFGRMDIANELAITKSPASAILNKLYSVGAVMPVSGAGKGKYRFDPAFFR